MEPYVIVFSDIRFKEVGRVTFDGKTLSGDTGFAEGMVRDAQYKKQSPEEFLKYFGQWSNGRYWSEKE